MQRDATSAAVGQGDASASPQGDDGVNAFVRGARWAPAPVASRPRQGPGTRVPPRPWGSAPLSRTEPPDPGAGKLSMLSTRQVSRARPSSSLCRRVGELSCPALRIETPLSKRRSDARHPRCAILMPDRGFSRQCAPCFRIVRRPFRCTRGSRARPLAPQERPRRHSQTAKAVGKTLRQALSDLCLYESIPREAIQAAIMTLR